jgi:hypothetical protein
MMLYVSQSKRPGQLSRIALGYGQDDRGFLSRYGLRIFLFTTASRPVLGATQPPPTHWVPAALSLGVKRPGREADHSPPSSAEVKNAWSYTPLPQYAFKARCSEHRDKSILTLPYQTPALYENGGQFHAVPVLPSKKQWGNYRIRPGRNSGVEENPAPTGNRVPVFQPVASSGSYAALCSV